MDLRNMTFSDDSDSDLQDDMEESGNYTSGHYRIYNKNFLKLRISNNDMPFRKKHIRRCAKELKKDYPCLYNCGKSYATDAARNMHMRTKHNELTKTERDRKARDIIRTCGLKNNTEIVTKLS